MKAGLASNVGNIATIAAPTTAAPSVASLETDEGLPDPVKAAPGPNGEEYYYYYYYYDDEEGEEGGQKRVQS